MLKLGLKILILTGRNLQTDLQKFDLNRQKNLKEAEHMKVKTNVKSGPDEEGIPK